MSSMTRYCCALPFNLNSNLTSSPGLRHGDSKNHFLDLSASSQLPSDLCLSGLTFAPQTFTARESGKNVLCGVDISVIVCATIRAVPFTNIQRQFFNDVTALAASLRTRKPSVNLDQRATVPVTLVFKLPDQLTPTCVTDRKSKLPILDHILRSQIFDGNRLIFTYQSNRQLVNKILSGISNFLMHLCDFKPCFVAIVRPFLLSTQCLLSFLEFAAFCVKAFGIGNLFTVTQSNQTCDTQINPNLIGAFRQWFNLNIHQQGNCPSSSSRELHRDSCWCCAFGQFSTPANRQRRANTWQGTLARF